MALIAQSSSEVRKNVLSTMRQSFFAGISIATVIFYIGAVMAEQPQYGEPDFALTTTFISKNLLYIGLFAVLVAVAASTWLSAKNIRMQYINTMREKLRSNRIDLQYWVDRRKYTEENPKVANSFPVSEYNKNIFLYEERIKELSGEMEMIGVEELDPVIVN